MYVCMRRGSCMSSGEKPDIVIGNYVCTTLAPQIHADVYPCMIKVVHNTCNMCTSGADLSTRVHMSGRTLVPLLQL